MAVGLGGPLGLDDGLHQINHDWRLFCIEGMMVLPVHKVCGSEGDVHESTLSSLHGCMPPAVEGHSSSFRGIWRAPACIMARGLGWAPALASGNGEVSEALVGKKQLRLGSFLSLRGWRP